MKANHLNALQRDLKPCPFCGGPAKLQPMPKTECWWKVQCDDFGCGGRNWSMQSPELAAQAWNRRHGEA